MRGRAKVFLFIFMLAFAPVVANAGDPFYLREGSVVHVLENEKYFPALMEKIRGAKKSIKICMYLFKTTDSPNNLANQVLDALAGAAKKGVAVEALLEANDRPDDNLNDHNRQTAGKLRKAGIKARFDRRDVNTHSKLVVIDGEWVFVGSHNLTHTALSRSHETSLMVRSRELAEYFSRYIEDIE